MNVKKELINRLGVPENWDKYDYQTQRYSFDDMQEVLEDIVKKLNTPAVEGQSEQLPPTCLDGFDDDKFCDRSGECQWCKDIRR
jgi:hypothetical protein